MKDLLKKFLIKKLNKKNSSSVHHLHSLQIKEQYFKLLFDGIRNAKDLDDLLKVSVISVGKLIGADRCVIALANEEKKCFDFKHQYRVREEIPALKGDELSIETCRSFFNDLSINRKPIFINNTQSFQIDLESKEFFKKQNIKSAISMPIVENDLLLGVFFIHQVKEIKKWSRYDIEILQSLSMQTATFIKQAQLYADVKRQAEREIVLRKIIETIRNSLDLNQVLSNVCKEIGKNFNVDRATIIHFFDSKDFSKWKLREEYKTNISITGIKDIDFNKEIGFFWGKQLNKGPLFLKEIESANIPKLLKDTYSEMGIKTLLGIPIKKGKDCWGGLFLAENKRVKDWTEADINFLESVADQIYIAIKQAELYLKIKKQADRERLLRHITQIIRSSLNINETKKIIVTEVATLVNADRCFIRLFDNDLNIFLPIDKNSEYISSPSINSIRDYTFNEDFDNFIIPLYKENHSFIIPSVEDLEEELGKEHIIPRVLMDILKVKSNYCFPIIDDNKLTGVFVVHYVQDNVYLEEEEINLLKTITRQAGFALKQAKLYSIAEKLANREHLLRMMAQSVSKSFELEEITKKACYEVAKIIKVGRVSIVKYTANAILGEILNEHTNEEYSQSYKKNDDLVLKVIAYWKESLSKKQDIIAVNNVFDFCNEDFWQEYHKLLGAKSVLIVPIKINDELWGFIALTEFKSFRIWLNDEINLIETISNQLSIAVKQSELYATTKKQAERERLLRKITESIRTTLDLNEMKNNIVSEIGKIFNADRCAIMQYDKINQKFLSIDKYSQYISTAEIESHVGRNLEEQELNVFKDLYLNKKNELILPDIDNEININSRILEIFKSLKIKSNFTVLITHGDDFLGVLYLNYVNQKKELSTEDLDFFRSLANQSGIALKQAELYTKTKKQSEREVLLRKISETIRSSLDLNETLQIICKELAKIYNVDRVTVAEISKDEPFNLVNRYDYKRYLNVKTRSSGSQL